MWNLNFISSYPIGPILYCNIIYHYILLNIKWPKYKNDFIVKKRKKNVPLYNG